MSLQSGSYSALSSRLLLLLFSVQVKALLRHGLELLAVVLLQLLNAVLVDRVNHVQHLDALLAQGLDEWRARDALDALAGDVVDVVLPLLHAVAVLLQADLLVTGLGRLEAEEIRQLRAVRRVLVDAELQVLPELLVELLVIVSLLRDLREHLEALLHEVLLDHAEDLVLLQRLARDVEWQVLRIYNALDEAEPLRDQLLAVVHDEDAAHVQLDVVALLLRLEEVERRAT